MILIAGLGNPGEKYKNTRHNIGFKAIEKIATNFQFPTSEYQSKFNVQISRQLINGKNIIIAKPLSFMNLSGEPISKIAQFYKMPFQNIIIIHDDIDIPLGKIKIIKNKGAGGHKGIISIIQKIGNKGFIRIRIGICPEKKPINPEIFVLQKFKKEEESLVKDALIKVVESVDMIINEGVDKSASFFNK
jgi:peptidyl-tRNA hydrolase, PTH1 family